MNHSNSFSSLIEKHWKDVQGNSRPDESFRAFFTVLLKWKEYMDDFAETLDRRRDVYDVMRDVGLNPMQAFPAACLNRIEIIGRAQERLKMILEDGIFAERLKCNIDNPEVDDFIDEVRTKFRCLEDNLWDLWALLKGNDE